MRIKNMMGIMRRGAVDDIGEEIAREILTGEKDERKGGR